jgi:hypothetical protein
MGAEISRSENFQVVTIKKSLLFGRDSISSGSFVGVLVFLIQLDAFTFFVFMGTGLATGTEYG